MRTIVAVIGMTFVLNAYSQDSRACTATNTVDVARSQKDSDEYREARDVAEEFIDEEGFVRDAVTIDTAIGTLMIDKTYWQAALENGGFEFAARIGRATESDVPTDYRTLLETISAYASHGMDAEGNLYENPDPCFTRPVKDHVRQHVSEWSEALQGRDPNGLLEWLTEYENGGGKEGWVTPWWNKTDPNTNKSWGEGSWDGLRAAGRSSTKTAVTGSDPLVTPSKPTAPASSQPAPAVVPAPATTPTPARLPAVPAIQRAG